ncbi:predicted protein [Histoplasma mississippiense (nom. inval.)]|uniref:predicted protein n=1 Tax=Ajellomyces capsulatus (strain NAm1 / WU24) TaxID=2059318 RepID=UPI000157BDC4|nr:predicted protein [Histoplasma mississippiense (nom. inval.)]EDN06306.1 predicted protein [Histoplasma mississippiense (nom. inval.)]
MVKDTGVDGAVVTTTPGTHFALAELALKGGKYVIVEKLFTPTHQEADELVALLKCLIASAYIATYISFGTY